MNLFVRHNAAGGDRPWQVVSDDGIRETVQEACATQADANAAIPEIRKALKQSYRL